MEGAEQQQQQQQQEERQRDGPEGGRSRRTGPKRTITLQGRLKVGVHVAVRGCERCFFFQDGHPGRRALLETRTALAAGHLPLLRLWMRRKGRTRIHISAKHVQGTANALAWAAANGQVETVRWALQDGGLSLDTKDLLWGTRWRNLMAGAIQSGDASLEEFVLKLMEECTHRAIVGRRNVGMFAQDGLEVATMSTGPRAMQWVEYFAQTATVESSSHTWAKLLDSAAVSGDVEREAVLRRMGARCTSLVLSAAVQSRDLGMVQRAAEWVLQHVTEPSTTFLNCIVKAAGLKPRYTVANLGALFQDRTAFDADGSLRVLAPPTDLDRDFARLNRRALELVEFLAAAGGAAKSPLDLTAQEVQGQVFEAMWRSVRTGKLAVLEWLTQIRRPSDVPGARDHTRGWRITAAQCAVATACAEGYASVVRFMHEALPCSLAGNQNLFTQSARRGHLGLLEYLWSVREEEQEAARERMARQDTESTIDSDGSGDAAAAAAAARATRRSGTGSAIWDPVGLKNPRNVAPPCSDTVTAATASGNSLAVVEYLVGRRGLTVTMEAAQGAVLSGRTDVCRWLLEHAGSSERPGSRVFTGRMCFDAAAAGHLAVLEFLVDECGLEPSPATPTAACEEGALDVLQWLVDRYGPRGHSGPNARENTNLTAAAKEGHLAVCRFLLSRTHAKPSAAAISAAAAAGALDVVELLHHFGSPPVDAITMDTCVAEGHRHILHYLWEHALGDMGNVTAEVIALAGLQNDLGLLEFVYATCDRAEWDAARNGIHTGDLTKEHLDEAARLAQGRLGALRTLARASGPANSANNSSGGCAVS